MKKILVLLSLICLFIVGLFSASNFAYSQNIYNSISLKSASNIVSQIVDIVDEGTINSYSLTDEHHFLSKNKNNNQVNCVNKLIESQLGSVTAKSFDSLDVIVTLPYSNNVVNLTRVYLTQASPRAP